MTSGSVWPPGNFFAPPGIFPLQEGTRLYISASLKDAGVAQG